MLSDVTTWSSKTISFWTIPPVQEATSFLARLIELNGRVRRSAVPALALTGLNEFAHAREAVRGRLPIELSPLPEQVPALSLQDGHRFVLTGSAQWLPDGSRSVTAA